ncbi:X-Pro dipeptidyl-peptidase C-terminal non-catalytic domain-containing protein [Meredithblackwellia eburnea MCA 4105]
MVVQLPVEPLWAKPFTPLTHPAPSFKYYGLEPGTTILAKGHKRFEGKREFPCDVVFERDSKVPMRDGINLRADVFRLPGEQKVPAIICWSPYGKTGTGLQHYDFMAPFSCGIPADKTTGYEKFEAPDPAEWCPRGYAIVNPDARGSFDSEGNAVYWGPQEAEDVYDLIEWVSKQSWCSGNVTMAGNSWLAICQINHVSRCPHPALKCFAPWEALSDPYRDWFGRGGIPEWVKGFKGLINNGFCGYGQVEQATAMVGPHPFFDEYWATKRIPVENIDIPMYCLASYSSMIHPHGSIRTFREAKTPKKWLRIHPTWEWYDMYVEESINDLQRFFDFYLKGIQNGWETDTPKVRLSLLSFSADGSPSRLVKERPETSYPPERVRLEKYFLDASCRKLVRESLEEEVVASYEGRSLTETVDFTIVFDKYTELAGSSRIKLWMSCPDHDNMDVVVQLRKIGRDGRMLAHNNYPVPVSIAELPQVNTVLHVGTQGVLRASHSCTYNASLSRPDEPFYDHDRGEPITPLGKIVSVDIGIWPWGAVFEAGEGVVVRVAGWDMCLPELELVRPREPELGNKGRHFVHCGGKYDSHILLPLM